MFFLVCSCSSDITIQNTDTQYSDTQTQQVQTADTREIEIGRAFSLDQIKSISLFDSELNKLYDVECGDFFTVEDGGEEAVYQYGNMTVDIKGDQGAIMRVIGIPDGLHIKYNELLIDNNFNPKSLSLKQFEIHENKATVSDNIVGIESTDIKTFYDTEYLIREKTSDELLYLSFLGNKLVAIRVLVQCWSIRNQYKKYEIFLGWFLFSFRKFNEQKHRSSIKSYYVRYPQNQPRSNQVISIITNPRYIQIFVLPKLKKSYLFLDIYPAKTHKNSISEAIKKLWSQYFLWLNQPI